MDSRGSKTDQITGWVHIKYIFSICGSYDKLYEARKELDKCEESDLPVYFILTNLSNVDPDQLLQNASNQGLHCFPLQQFFRQVKFELFY